MFAVLTEIRASGGKVPLVGRGQFGPFETRQAAEQIALVLASRADVLSVAIVDGEARQEGSNASGE